MNTKISVALCTYNGSKYINEQLDSIAAQTRLPDELVICDDVSTDDTVQIIKDFISTTSFPVHLYINDTNIGSTKNFEKAIGICTGDIIVLSDQDDVWSVEKLVKLERAFLEYPGSGAVFSNADVVDKGLKPLGYSLWNAVKFNRKEIRAFHEGNQVNILLKHNVITGATLAFRASYKDKVLPIPCIWIHDAWIAFIISTLSEIIVLDESLIKYRQHYAQQVGMENIRVKNMMTMILSFNKHSDKIDRYVEGVNKYRTIEADRYKIALKRYLSTKRFSDANITRLINEKIAHSEARAGLPSNRLLRLPIIFKELILFRYRRYSHRTIFALMDFIF